MKKGFIPILMLIFFIFANVGEVLPQIPKTINYQAELRDENDMLLNGTFLITFSIYEDETDNILIWTEYQEVMAVNGYINVYLGKSNPLNLDFDKQYWLEISIGTDGAPFPRVPLSSVPYAMRSNFAMASNVADSALTVKNKSITEDKFAIGVGLPPKGSAGGDLMGNYPAPEIRNGVISEDKIANDAVYPKHINGQLGQENDALIVDAGGNVVWGYQPSSTTFPLEGGGSITDPIRMSASEDFVTDDQLLLFKDNEWFAGKISPENINSTNTVGETLDGYALTWNNAAGKMRWGFPKIFAYVREPLTGAGEENNPIKIMDGNLNDILYFNGTIWDYGQLSEVIPPGEIKYDHLEDGIPEHVLTYTDSGWHAYKITPKQLNTANTVGPVVDGYALTWDNDLQQMAWSSSSSTVTTQAPLLGDGHATPLSLAGGTTNFQILYWHQPSGEWRYSNSTAPGPDQVLKWNNSGDGSIEWGDAGIVLPYAYTGPAGGDVLFSINRNHSGGANYVSEIINSGTGKGLYLEANNSAPFLADPTNSEDAVLVVNNVNGAADKYAIKTYGNIWAHGKVGANIMTSAQTISLGVPGSGAEAVFTAPSGVGAPVILDTDIEVQGSLRLASGSTVNELSTDGTLVDNSDAALPTERAVKTYIDTEISALTNAWTDQLSIGPSPAAYIEAKVGGIAANAAVLYGGTANTHINLGFGGSETGSNGMDYSYCTVSGGLSNSAANHYSSVGGGWNNEASGYASVVSGGWNNEAFGDRSVVAGGSYLRVGTRSFGFRGGIGSNPVTLTDLSSAPETFHIVDANFQFNYNNEAANFRVDGDNEDYVLYMDASTDMVGIGTSTPLQKLHVNGVLKLGNNADPVAGAIRYQSNQVQVNDGVNGWVRLGNFNLTNNVLYTAGVWGFAKSGTTLYGTATSTHVNLGNFNSGASVTGQNGQNRQFCSVLGGSRNTASHNGSTVAGGYYNNATGENSFIGGGNTNNSNGTNSNISGGTSNTASGANSTIGGGGNNTASADAAIIAGGFGNTASSSGLNGGSTVGGGMLNTASADWATVGGGMSNTANGINSVIPGGSFLVVGDRSFGFRGGIGVNPSTPTDVSAEDETFHIVDANFHFNYSNANADFRVDGQLNDNLIFAQASTNRVGIGTNAPTVAFQIGTNGDGSGALANVWNTFSDIRLKKDITPLENALEKLDKINGYYYYWKKGADKSRQVGVIAQEIEKVLPEIVTTTSDDIKTVDYSKLSALLIQAVKEQQEIIKKQNEKIKELENASVEIAQLKEQYELLRTQNNQLQKMMIKLTNLIEKEKNDEIRTVSK